eukprot:293840-Rhodomonas_salina.3
MTRPSTGRASGSDELSGSASRAQKEGIVEQRAVGSQGGAGPSVPQRSSIPPARAAHTRRQNAALTSLSQHSGDQKCGFFRYISQCSRNSLRTSRSECVGRRLSACRARLSPRLEV